MGQKGYLGHSGAALCYDLTVLLFRLYPSLLLMSILGRYRNGQEAATMSLQSCSIRVLCHRRIATAGHLHPCQARRKDARMWLPTAILVLTLSSPNLQSTR